MRHRPGVRKGPLAAAMILTLLLIAGCQRPTPGSEADRQKQLVREMRNEDVHWDGTYAGLWPTLNGPALALRDTEQPVEPLLLEALLDEERYAAAHVLLTLRTTSSFTGGVSDWNGLRIRLFAGGSVSYAGNDLEALHRQWAEKLAQAR